MIDILTDNVNRSSASVRAAVTKAGGKMADPGSVVFNFQRQGLVLLSGGSEESVFTAATEAGADDVLPRSDGEPGWEVVTQVPMYGAVLAALRDAGLPTVAEECGLRMVPLARVSVDDDEAFEKNLKLIDTLLELDDVDAVVRGFPVSDGLQFAHLHAGDQPGRRLIYYPCAHGGSKARNTSHGECARGAAVDWLGGTGNRR